MKIKIASSWKDLGIEDEIGLISQIYGGYPNKIVTINIAHIDSEHARAFIESQESFCGIEKLSTIHKFVRFGALTIDEESTIDFHNPGWSLHDYTVSVNWEKMHYFAGFYHDTEALKPFGSIQQEKIMRKIIFKKATDKNSNKFSLSEWDLGSFIAEPIDDIRYSFDSSPDLNIKFMTTLFQLERDGFIKITGLDFDFDNNRKFLKNVSYDDADEEPIYDDYYLPANHCHVEIELLEDVNVKKQKDEDKTEENSNTITITKNWRLVAKEYEAYIYNTNKNLFTFSRLTSNTYLYFKHLCKNYGKKIAYEEMYQVGKEIKGWNKLKRWETNAAVRRTINKLKESFKNKKLKQICINTKEYLMLTILL